MKFRTIAEAIETVGTRAPHRGLTFQDMKGNETYYPFPELVEAATQRAAGLQALGLKKGDRFGLIVVEPEDFVLTFLGALRIGVLPVPLYPPLSFGSLDAYAARTAKVLDSAGARLLVASAKLRNVLWALIDEVPSLERLVQAEDLTTATGEADLPVIEPDDLAFLQYTSGSTSDPKGVMVTHGSLAANCWAIMNPGIKSHMDRDLGVSWLPLYHDMGLIGFVIAPITQAVPIVYIPTLRFLRRPRVWFEAMHRHQATLTFAPNFAYALAVRKAREQDLEAWDLSKVRILGCGAEPIHPETMRSFLDLFTTHCDLAEEAMLPCYGMAEATLAISFIDVDGKMPFNVVDADAFQEDGTVSAPQSDDAATFEHVSCGVPFPDHEIGIFSDDGVMLGESREGEIRVRGASNTVGYFDNPEATAAAFLPDGWLRTGDLGYIHDGQLYVTGRIKDLIILNGRNIHPQAIEWTAAEQQGVRKGNVVAFSRPGANSEELIVVLETRDADHETLAATVKKAVQREHSVTVTQVVCVSAGVLPKTSSGKLQRRKTRDLFMRGRLGVEGSRDPSSTAGTVTLAKHMAKSMWTRAKTAVLSR